ncbi:MAG: S-formylglutathione hydrolase [Gammaproteobacteria bacterium]|nr:MAG: S-formylglutathione hydrolase [Gammaproteobacteria bacterium]
MAASTLVESRRAFGGTLSVHDHASEACGCTMRYAVYLPPGDGGKAWPVLWYLSGLTCNWSNASEKGGLFRAAAEHGIAIVLPDTSPRGDDVANDEAYDLGQGAGFYLTATESPWSAHYRMDQYIVEELSSLLFDTLPLDPESQGITGHSMGGHGALTLHLKHPDRYRSCSAFSPVVNPMEVPWGRKAFTNYLGENRDAWASHDATMLVGKGASKATLLIDTGDADPFLDEQLRPEAFIEACKAAGQALNYRMQKGYDHSYYFVSTFADEHIAHHARALGAGAS